MKYTTETTIENGQEYEVRVYDDGDKHWFQNNKRHRLDGPAIDWPDGYKAWYVNDKLHRLDGPAVEHPNGSKEYWINGIEYRYENWKREVRNITMVQQIKDLKKQNIEGSNAYAVGWNSAINTILSDILNIEL